MNSLIQVKKRIEIIKKNIKDGNDHHTAKRYEDSIKCFILAIQFIHNEIMEDNFITERNKFELAKKQMELMHRVKVIRSQLEKEKEEQEELKALQKLALEKNKKELHEAIGNPLKETSTPEKRLPKAIPESKQEEIEDSLHFQKELVEARAAIRTRVTPTRPTITFDDIIGHKEAKDRLILELVDPIETPNLFNKKRDQSRGIILYGPPGTGKTSLAKAAANAAGNMTFLEVAPTSLASAYKGGSELLIQALFEMASEHAPCIVFFDELEQIFKDRDQNGSGGSTCTALLVNSQGREGVYMIGATNAPWDLDRAFHRRFENNMVYVDIPSVSEIYQLMEKFLQPTSIITSVQLRNFCNRLKGASFDDVMIIVKWLNQQPLRMTKAAQKFIKAGPNQVTPTTLDNKKGFFMSYKDMQKTVVFVHPPLTVPDLMEAIKQRKPGNYEKLRKKYKDFENNKEVEDEAPRKVFVVPQDKPA